MNLTSRPRDYLGGRSARRKAATHIARTDGWTSKTYRTVLPVLQWEGTLRGSDHALQCRCLFLWPGQINRNPGSPVFRPAAFGAGVFTLVANCASVSRSRRFVMPVPNPQRSNHFQFTFTLLWGWGEPWTPAPSWTWAVLAGKWQLALREG